MYKTNTTTLRELFDIDAKALWNMADTMFTDDHFMVGELSKYPPTNIISQGDNIVIEMAVAGYTKEQLTVTMDDNTLTIKGSREILDDKIKYIRKGISSKNFSNSYKITNREVESVSLNDGLLRITLKSIPPKSTKVEFEIK